MVLGRISADGPGQGGARSIPDEAPVPAAVPSGARDEDEDVDGESPNASAVGCVHPAEMGFDGGDVADSEFPTELPEGFVLPVDGADGVPDSVAEEDFSGATDGQDGDSIEAWVKKIPQSTRDLLEKEFRMQYTRVVQIKNPLSK
ncbi:MAG: hypothetical protein JW706_03245 [Opitutales bacterium]|nr:hypothetical protein [Opitutales bacterium]